jgi:hypothetical protein
LAASYKINSIETCKKVSSFLVFGFQFLAELAGAAGPLGIKGVGWENGFWFWRFTGSIQTSEFSNQLHKKVFLFCTPVALGLC